MTMPIAQPFTTATGLAEGLSYKQLTGPRFAPVHPGRGIWDTVATDRTLPELLAADRLVLPPDAAISHLTGLLLYGLDVDPGPRRHWSTARPDKRRLRSITLHRRGSLGPLRDLDGLPVLAPERCLADMATHVSLVWLAGAGDALIAAKVVSLASLQAFTRGSFHGSTRLRQAVKLMRTNTGSFRESGTRLMIACAHLPEAERGVSIYNEFGEFIGDPDMFWRRQGITGEYDGWYHERTAQQRDYDIRRLEGFRNVGLHPVTLTSGDYARPTLLAQRLWKAFELRGFGANHPPFDLRRWYQLSTPPRGRRDPKLPPWTRRSKPSPLERDSPGNSCFG